MKRYYRTVSMFIGLLIIIGVTQVQGAMVPFNLNQTDISPRVKPVDVMADHMRVPLAVPSFGHATTTREWTPDLLPLSEQMYQDRHWGYWLGFSSWNGYSFLLTGESPYWGRYWGTTGTSRSPIATTQVPEPATLMLFGFVGAWLVAGHRRLRNTA